MGNKIVESLKVTNLEVLYNYCNQAKNENPDNPIDCVELRLDYLSPIDSQTIAALKNFKHSIALIKNSDFKIIYTLRTKPEGGSYSQSENQRLTDIRNLMKLEPDYFDIESITDNREVKKLNTEFPNINLICSYHNFNHTPDNLDEIFSSMQSSLFSHYKIATMAQSSLDGIRMMKFLQESNAKKNLTSFCMGEIGKFTRIIAKIFNSEFCYIADKDKTASGQLSKLDLKIYNYNKINSKTKIYALLGSPVNKSIGHLFHNYAFSLLNENAVYVKIQLEKNEVQQFLDEILNLPFYGFSVTMPLKQCFHTNLVNNECNRHDDEINTPINTIKIEDKQTTENTRLYDKHLNFYNTDGIGAIKSLAKHIQSKSQFQKENFKSCLMDKKILIFGAGGTAFAIGCSALKYGATVFITNRTSSKGKRLAKSINCHYLGIQDIILNDYDVIINTTPSNPLNQIIDKGGNVKNTQQVFLDVVYNPIQTDFLKCSIPENIVPGYNMFLEQGIKQLEIWL